MKSEPHDNLKLNHLYFVNFNYALDFNGFIWRGGNDTLIMVRNYFIPNALVK